MRKLYMFILSNATVFTAFRAENIVHYLRKMFVPIWKLRYKVGLRPFDWTIITDSPMTRLGI